MLRKRHDELHSFLEWRRQTRFVRHYGGPIVAIALFATGLCFVWRACNGRVKTPKDGVEAHHQEEMNHLLQASKSPRM